MYYRYKTKKNNSGFFKFFVIFLVVCACAFGAWKFRSHLMFWKFSINKLDGMIYSVKREAPAEQRLAKLQAVLAKTQKHRSAEPLSAEANLAEARVRFLLGEAYLGKTFGQIVAENLSPDVSEKAREDFVLAIKYIRKAQTLSDSEKLSDFDWLILAKSSAYISYYSPEENLSFVEKIEEPLNIRYNDDAYFYAIALISSGRGGDGVEYLKKRNFADPYSKLIVASAYSAAKQYTESIKQYREIMAECTDENLLRIAKINLGKTYFSQSLFAETVAVLDGVILPEETNPELRAVMEKAYLQTGDALKAKLFAPVAEKKN